jgi:hypothetical protein
MLLVLLPPKNLGCGAAIYLRAVASLVARPLRNKKHKQTQNQKTPYFLAVDDGKPKLNCIITMTT